MALFHTLTAINPLQRKLSFPAIKSFDVPSRIQCKSSINASTHRPATQPPSEHFQPSIWHYDYIQSLSNEHKNESHKMESRVLKEEIKIILYKASDHLEQLELIDILQRLGVAYHFKDEIRNMLDNIYKTKAFNMKNDLYTTSLEFRLLRQNGYDISTAVFDCFLDETRKFKELQTTNVAGILSLYEASFHSMEDEAILDDATNFTSKFLKEYVNNNSDDSYISTLINHALEFPLHWRVPRWESHWFIHVYERSPNFYPLVLRFAKLDFNLIQSICKEELKEASRWWKAVDLVENLSISRDRLVENYFTGVGMNFSPDLGYFRINMAKVNCFVTLLDDIYDVYGTMEELEIFTDVIERWDLNAIESLPHYMKTCFLALNNYVNDVAFETLKENGNIIIPNIRKSWIDFCKASFNEAKWYHSGCTPSFKEYMDNAWISMGATVLIVHAYFMVPNSSKKEDLGNLQEYPNIIRLSSILLRLANDLGTSKRESKTGDVPKAIECYMNETGVCEAHAREHVKRMIGSTWKMMNNEVCHSTFTRNLLDVVENIPKLGLCFYQYDDGYTIQDSETINRIFSLVMQPVAY